MNDSDTILSDLTDRHYPKVPSDPTGVDARRAAAEELMQHLYAIILFADTAEKLLTDQPEQIPGLLQVIQAEAAKGYALSKQIVVAP